MKIVVDADACPRSVLQICLRLGKEFNVAVWTVASFNHHIENEHHVMVGNAPQEADIKVVNLAEPGDVAVTQDWGLAAMLMGRGVRCLNPAGYQYSSRKIEFLLEERNLKARYRRGGGRTRGPKKRTPELDVRFEAALARCLKAGGDNPEQRPHE